MPGLRIPSTPIVVDLFRDFPDPVLYFLTHGHADHLCGLHDGWNNGRIFCSHITRLFLLRKFNLDPSSVIALEDNVSSAICLPHDTFFTSVTPLNANHCPGAVMFLFEGAGIPGGTCLHTGDCRFDPKLMLPALEGKIIDTLFLDNTYLHRRVREPSNEALHWNHNASAGSHECHKWNFPHGWIFPPREEATAQVLQLIEEHARKHSEKRQVFASEMSRDRIFRQESTEAPVPEAVIGVHCIGKEELLMSVAVRFGIRVRASKSRLGTLRLVFGVAQTEKYFTQYASKDSADLAAEREKNIRVRAVHLRELHKQALDRWNRVRPTIGIAPTGIPRSGQHIIHVPYSLHSSHSELVSFVASVRPRSVVGTSKDSAADQAALKNIVAPFLSSQDSNRRGLLKLLRPKKVPESLIDVMLRGGGHARGKGLDRRQTLCARLNTSGCQHAGSLQNRAGLQTTAYSIRRTTSARKQINLSRRHRYGSGKRKKGASLGKRKHVEVSPNDVAVDNCQNDDSESDGSSGILDVYRKCDAEGCDERVDVTTPNALACKFCDHLQMSRRFFCCKEHRRNHVSRHHINHNPRSMNCGDYDGACKDRNFDLGFKGFIGKVDSCNAGKGLRLATAPFLPRLVRAVQLKRLGSVGNSSQLVGRKKRPRCFCYWETWKDSLSEKSHPRSQLN
jgi:hypothetical protein